ncbi:hypothetical protein [Tortoise microvirus 89]|nr:hypothetical protein [Tortoise microvirus 89]
MERKVRNWLNNHEFLYVGEVNDMPSLTKPDDTLSISEILDRYSRGLPLTGMKVPVFDEYDDTPDIRTLDLSERFDLTAEFHEELKEIRSNAARRRAEREAKLAAEREEMELIRKEVQKRKKEADEAENSTNPS